MKKILISIFFLSYFLVGCGTLNRDVSSVEQPQIVKEDIEVIVTNIERNHWFASTHWYEVKVTVKNTEYNLEKTFYYNGQGAFGCPSEWQYEKNDVLTGEMYSWVIASTQEIVKREINALK